MFVLLLSQVVVCLTSKTPNICLLLYFIFQIWNLQKHSSCGETFILSWNIPPVVKHSSCRETFLLSWNIPPVVKHSSCGETFILSWKTSNRLPNNPCQGNHSPNEHETCSSKQCAFHAGAKELIINKHAYCMRMHEPGSQFPWHKRHVAFCPLHKLWVAVLICTILMQTLCCFRSST